MQDIEGRVAAGVITELVKQTVNPIKEYVSKKWSKSEFKSEVELIDAYESYLIKSKEKYSKIKTILYKRTPKSLYSFYENLHVKHEDEIVDTSSIQNLISIGNRIIITGTGGIGKSTMMKHLFQNSIDTQYLVPILIELRNLNDKFNVGEIDLLDYIYRNITNLDFKTEKIYLEYSLETGKNIILFDGLDEVKNEIINDVVQAIKEFGDKYNKCPIILTSRPSEVFVGWNDYIEVETCPLTKEQALALVKKLDFDNEVKLKFYENLDSRVYEDYESFASIPLLLTIMLITYDNSADIPNELHEFYEQAFSALFHTHDASKSGYKRDIATKLSYDRFKRLFAHLCFQSYLNSDYSFTEDKILGYISKSKEKFEPSTNFDEIDLLNDLTNSVCMLMKEGLDYVFSHRSFQEYFAAIYTTDLLDETQKKLFNEIVHEKIDCYGNRYVEILEQVQYKRFIKNFILPKAKLIKELIEKEAFHEILEIFFGDMTISEEFIAFPINNSAYYFIFEKVLQYQNIEKKGWSKEKTKILYHKILEVIKDKEELYHLEIAKLNQLGLLNDLIDIINLIPETKKFYEWINDVESGIDNEALTTEEFLSTL